jgi:MFS transporter, DHA1 family, multidrug resistance protein
MSDRIKKLIPPSLFILVLMVSIGPFGDTEYTPSLPRIARELGVHYNLVQLTMTSYLMGYAISQLFWGPLSDRFGRKPIMLIGASVFIAGSAVCYTSFDIWQLIGGRFIQAIGACAGGVISSAAVRDAYSEEQRGHVFAKINAAFAVAPGIGPIVGSFVDHSFGWHANFLILLVLSIILFICVWLFFPETNFHRIKNALHPKTFFHNYRLLFKDPYYWAYIIPMGFSIGIVYSALVGAPDLVINILHQPSYVVVVIALGVLIGFVAGSLTCNFLAGHYENNTLIFIGMCTMLLGSLLLALMSYVGWMSEYLTASIIPIMIIFAGIAFVIPLATAEALEPFEHVAGSASAMLGFFQMGLASISTGVMSSIPYDSAYSMPIIFTALSFFALLIFVPFILLRKGRERELV